MDQNEIAQFIQDIPDEVLARIQFTPPWQYDSSSPTSRRGQKDEDGFPVSSGSLTSELTRKELQAHCWDKFIRNPQVNTAVRGLTGRLTGYGFEAASDITQIQDVIEETELDPRNRLYTFWPKYNARANVEGELFLLLTVHVDGFVEVDFIDPGAIQGNDTPENGGIIYHPTKMMPLVYCIDPGNSEKKSQIPSIFLARYPELRTLAAKDKAYKKTQISKCKSTKRKYRSLGGFYKFVVAWDRGFMTRRSVSYLRTTIEWLNHYENLKKYEIDHKKSSGAYVWVVTMEDVRAYKAWIALTDEEKRKTGLMTKKTPGGTLVLPPGMDIKAINPTLPKISDTDTDIMQMITSGLNEPEDVATGSSRGSTYSSVKATRGPMSDRVADEVAYFSRFLRHDFWGAVFFLKSAVTNFPKTFSVEEAVGFKDQEPIFRKVKRRPEQLLELSFPTSEVVDYEARARAFLGVKHGSTYDVLGIPHSDIAAKLGVGNYRKARLRHATEENKYPELIMNADQEAIQETKEAEPSRGTVKKKGTPAKKE
jgi:hypothetical protein